MPSRQYLSDTWHKTDGKMPLSQRDDMLSRENVGNAVAGCLEVKVGNLMRMAHSIGDLKKGEIVIIADISNDRVISVWKASDIK